MTTLERLARAAGMATMTDGETARAWLVQVAERFAGVTAPGEAYALVDEAVLRMVRALLQELREPDEAMMEAGKAARGPLVAGNPPGVVCNAVFRAMINAILSDTPTPAEGRW